MRARRLIELLNQLYAETANPEYQQTSKATTRKLQIDGKSQVQFDMMSGHNEICFDLSLQYLKFYFCQDSENYSVLTLESGKSTICFDFISHCELDDVGSVSKSLVRDRKEEYGIITMNKQDFITREPQFVVERSGNFYTSPGMRRRGVEIILSEGSKSAYETPGQKITIYPAMNSIGGFV